jgi:hypothetical protein
MNVIILIDDACDCQFRDYRTNVYVQFVEVLLPKVIERAMNQLNPTLVKFLIKMAQNSFCYRIMRVHSMRYIEL